MVPQLCVALGCLPSQILKEDYNDIANILSVYYAQKKQQDAEQRKLKRR